MLNNKVMNVALSRCSCSWVSVALFWMVDNKVDEKKIYGTVTTVLIVLS
jgi:hypothetical protein